MLSHIRGFLTRYFAERRSFETILPYYGGFYFFGLRPLRELSNTPTQCTT